jgi:MFS family permease
VLQTIRRAEYTELVALFFLNAMALGIWFVPLSAVLDAHGLASIKPFAFATTGIAAFVSPLIFGAMADRHASPVAVLRGLAIATAAAMALATTSIRLGWPPLAVLGLIQLHALCSAPTFSISTTIVFSRLRDSPREFGPIRAMATFGWMCGCWIVSALGADASTRAGYTGAIAWLGVAAFTLLLPSVAPPKSAENLGWRQRLGWDAMALLKNRDHRVVFITAALFNIPWSAFFPYTPPHLRELGLRHTTAWMSIGQVSEIIAMFSLASLLARWRLKWIIGLGLTLALLRYGLCSLDGPIWVLSGTALHGCAFTLVLITSQIYLDERVDPAWRARAQALMYFMISGVGNFVGYLGTGWWFAACHSPTGQRWSMFWGGLAIAVGVVMAFFLTAYHGVGHGLRRNPPAKTGDSSA